MAYLPGLRAANSLHDVANLLGVKPSTLSFVLYKIPPEKKYTKFSVPKKSGGSRVICAPEARLKFVQHKLSKLLQNCQAEVETKLEVKKSCLLSHGFKPGHSIQTNASNHYGRRWVLNADIKDFFPSINFGRVYGFFLKNQHYALKKNVAAVIAQIACHENQLPQGSPCSPVISNIIANLLDIRLNELAFRHSCTYTRYADDLTFSTNEKEFPASIAMRDVENPHRWLAGSGLTKRVSRAGFAINASKTRMQYCDSRQEVTGLVVNEKVNVRVEYYKQARAMCWELFREGAAYERAGEVTAPVSIDKIRSMFSFIYHVKRWESVRRNEPPKQSDQRSYHRVYADLLNYISFSNQEYPTIVCEGKTDNVYLRCALRSLAADYPSLVKVEDGRRRLLVRLFKFTKTAAAVQKISGGADQLLTILATYRTMTKKFRVKPKHPTILLVDNDSGPEQLFKSLGKMLKKQVDGSEPYYLAYENLYVVPVPKIGTAYTPMEKLFEQVILDVELDGRKLDLTNKEPDGTKFYSKNEFSVHVVQKHQKAINFAGFKPLLNAIVAVQKDYARKVALAAASAAAAGA